MTKRNLRKSRNSSVTTIYSHHKVSNIQRLSSRDGPWDFSPFLQDGLGSSKDCEGHRACYLPQVAGLMDVCSGAWCETAVSNGMVVATPTISPIPNPILNPRLNRREYAMLSVTWQTWRISQSICPPRNGFESIQTFANLKLTHSPKESQGVSRSESWFFPVNLP